jgi:hypothetical protein
MLSNDIIPIIFGDDVDKLRYFINQIYTFDTFEGLCLL